MSKQSKNIFAWAMYDWANSAYAVTVLVAVMPIYWAEGIVPEGGVHLFGTLMTAEVLWPYMISAAAVMAFIAAPVLGAIADFNANKRGFLTFFCVLGAAATMGLFMCGEGDVIPAMILFILSNIGFVGGNVFYDAFLTDIADDDSIDWISGKGYAYGYVGGGLQLALSLGFILGADSFGIDGGMAARIVLLFTGLWWFGFALITLGNLRDQGTPAELPDEYKSKSRYLALAKIGLKRTLETTGKIRRFRHVVFFLLAFLVYNDAVQTVITQASLFGSQEMGLESTTLMITILIIQFVAFFGALLFGWMGRKIGSKNSLIISLFVWCAIVIYAYFMESQMEFFALGVILGLVLGGVQSLSRSLYGSMIPRQAGAEFYGFYSVFAKFSTIFGPAVFGAVTQVTGSMRQAILSLIVFFIIGIALLLFVNVSEARKLKQGELFSGSN